MRVLLNSCTHRGATLCREKAGNGRYLRCFYHGWNFDTTGRLVSVPGEEGYGPGFDRSALGLATPARVDSYRGFVFASFNPGVEDLVDYLAGAREYLDLICDQSEQGMVILNGSHEYSARANWKLLVENSFDGYHLLHVHQRYLKMTKAAGRELVIGGSAYTSHGADLGNGHALIQGTEGGVRVGLPLPTESAQRQWDAHRERLGELYGKPWTDRMYGSRNLVIFPNLAVIDLVGGITVRKIDPISPDLMEVEAWELAPAVEDPELRANRLDNFLTFWGPGGLATPDDIEALECCQRGLRTAREQPWSDISRGMASEVITSMDELQMRTFWRRWNEYMTGEKHPPEPHPTPDAFTARRPGVPAGAAR